MTQIAVHRLPGLVLKSHEFRLPLDYARPHAEQIVVFAREAVAPEQEGRDLPWLLFLQGGPGFLAPRPTAASGWLKRALREYRVLLLDQRGTGNSAPILPQTLAHAHAHIHAPSGPQAQAEYLTHFRADNIVRDAEAIRAQLAGPSTPWSVLGQSYGGFCVVHYLSTAPHSLREAIITGGLPPLDRPPFEVYCATYRRLIEKNRRYYERYPGDKPLVRSLARLLNERDIRLPDGDRLTERRLRQLGFHFGASDGLETVHYLLESALLNGVHGPEVSFSFLRQIEQALPFETNPIFAILHEPIYCQVEAADWAAQRALADFPEFQSCPERPLLFTGEMIYPWMFDEYANLRPLREAAHLLAQHAAWPRLYHLDILAANRVPTVAAIYYDDMYVDRDLSLESAQRIRGLRYWLTNEYEHNALRADGETLLDRLLVLLRGG